MKPFSFRRLARLFRRLPERRVLAGVSFGRADLDLAMRDFGVLVFGVLALAALVASVPYTYSKVLGLHDLTQLGTLQSIGSLIVFEAGAFLAKVGVLFIPEWRRRLSMTQVGLLLIVAIANYQVAKTGNPAADVLELAIFVATMPFLQWLFLGMAVGRAEAIHAARLAEQRPPTQAEQAQARFEQLRDQTFDRILSLALGNVSDRLADGLRSNPQLPAQPIYDAPREQRTAAVATPNFVCDVCSQEASAMQRRTANQHGAWVCKGCGKRCAAQG